MTTLRSALLVGLALVTTLGACSAGAGPSLSPAASRAPSISSPTTPAALTPVPDGAGGSEDPDTGVVDPNPGVGGGDGQPRFVVPKPGTLDPRPVSVETLEARVTGRKVVIVATWWSGQEPCYTLDTVAVKGDGHEFTVALTEGSAQRDAMCIEIAVQKATAIDLGELAPGQYTVKAQDSTAEPITFTVA
jgi:hypothetical protein